jgi:hypothetical protein
MTTRSYEIYQKRGDDWMIIGASDAREDALAKAHSLIEAFPRSQVQVIEERFDPATARAAATIVFRGNRETLTAPPPRPRKPAPVRLPPPPSPKPPERSRGHLVAWGIGLATVVGIAILGLNWLSVACR